MNLDNVSRLFKRKAIRLAVPGEVRGMQEISVTFDDGEAITVHSPSIEGAWQALCNEAVERVGCEQMDPICDEGWSEWIHPLPGYLLQCCDCGLIHEMEYAIVPRDEELNTGPLNDGEGDSVILFRARRHKANRS